MKEITLFLLLLSARTLYAQQVDSLPNPYRRSVVAPGGHLYFAPASGTVETQDGRVVLGPGLYMPAGAEDVPEVELSSLYFDLVDTTASRRGSSMHFSYGYCTFDGKGHLLYHPFQFDNGPDYWVEGRRRFVEAEKMGMVNRLGHRVVPARDYSFISPMRNGYAIGCRDCRYTVFDSTDSEHGAGYSGSKYDLLDADGKVVRRLSSQQPDKSLDSLHLPRRYKNEAAVKKLQQMLQSLPETAEAAARMYVPADSCTYVCYDEPSAASNWYHFGFEDIAGLNSGAELQWLISRDGKSIMHLNRSLDQMLPYKTWHEQVNKWDY